MLRFEGFRLNVHFYIILPATLALPPPKRSEIGAFYLVFGPMELSAGLGYTTATGGPPGMVALAKPIVTSDASVVRRCMGSRTLCCATTACAAWRVSRGW